MKSVSASLMLMIGLLLSTSARTTRDPTTIEDSLEARRAAIKKLYDAQDLMLNKLAGKDEASTRLIALLTSKARGELHSIDRQGAQDLLTAAKHTSDPNSSASILQFFTKNRELRMKYAQPFQGTLDGFWKKLLRLAAAATGPERDVLRQAERDSSWISENLNGNGIAQLDPKAKESFQGLFQLLGEYELTNDARILTALAEDLRILHLHCRETGSRADQETQFTSETIDVQNARVNNWIVTAMSRRGEVKRIGNPSNPVTGRLMPGRWFFFAEKGNERSRGGWHVVSHGRLEPTNILIRF